MSRLYLIFIVFLSVSTQAQKTRKLIKFADDQYKQGDYYYAIEYYNQALAKDSSNIDIMWKQAEALRAYKDYVKAEAAYTNIYAREKGKKFPKSLLYMGLMQKQNAKYTRALETFEEAARFYKSNENSYEYKKSVKEIESVRWAQSNYVVDSTDTLIKLPLSVNSFDAEFGHNVRDNHLIFSSLRGDSISKNNEEVYSRQYKTRLYISEIIDGEFADNERIDTLSIEKLNSGNGSFSLDGKYFYFSMCEDDGYNYRCQIMRAEYLGNSEWGRIDTLNEKLNSKGKNSTMPSIAEIDGKEILFFTSDRNGSKGGLDIWYAEIKNNEFVNISNLEGINSLDNELTPFYDDKQKQLFFSSSWHNGFGGLDIFYSSIGFNKNKLVVGEILNASLPINSPANDLYYFSHRDTIYLSSNRIGSYFSKNPTCCSDIYSKIIEIPDTIESIDTLVIVQEKIRNKLPVVLYFQNDEPDAKNWSSSTKLSYTETYEVYKNRYPEYLKKVSEGVEGSEATKRVNGLTDFFDHYVDKGVNDLNEFKSLLLEELKTGSKVILTVKGFASPLAKTNYNVNLTKRRISSLINYFKKVDNGVFKPFLSNKSSNGGVLEFVYAPFGEFSADQTTSDDFYDQKNSVYSREAGLDRKIHIDEVSFEKNQKVFPLKAKETVFTAGILEKGKRVKGKFILENEIESDVNFKVLNQNSSIKVISTDQRILPKGKAELSVELNTTLLSGFNRLSVFIEVEGFEKPLELFITTEVK